jgi:uncharacterized membrane protein
MTKWTKIAAAVLAGIAVVLLLYAVFAAEPTTTDTDTDHMGMWDSRTYSSTNLTLMLFASFLIAIAVMFILLKEDYEPLPPTMEPRPLPPPPPPPADEPKPEIIVTKAPEVAPAPQAKIEDERTKDSYLVLRLLTGDERVMFKAVMDSGGEALQKDLIQRTKMSSAKVSRLLDRLEEKGVITKDRHGSTNKVKIKLE